MRLARAPTCGRVQSATAIRLCVNVAARGGGGRGPPRPRFGSSGGGRAPPLTQQSSLRSSLSRLQSLWRSVKPQTVQKDPATGVHLAPDTPGSLGRPVRVLTNHVQLSTAFETVSSYRVSIAAGGDAATASTTPGEPLDVPQRERLLAQLAADRGWEAGSWQYDAASNSLYSRPGAASLEEAACSVSLVEQQGRGATTTTWQVSISKQPGGTGTASSSTLQLLGLLVKAELHASVHGLRGVVAGARIGLLPPGVLQPSPASSSSSSSSSSGGRGGDRGGGQRRGGRGAQGGRGRGGRGGGLTGGVLQYWDSVKLAVKATCQGPTLQVDSSAGAVLPAGPLSQLLRSAGADPAQLMSDRRLLAAAEDALKGAKIQLSYFPSGPRSAVVKGLVARSAAAYTFKGDGGFETSVAQHFASTYGVQLQHGRDWPCVMISRTGAIPLELCMVVAQPRKNLDKQQSVQLLRVAALPPDRRLAAFRTVFAKVLASWDMAPQWGLSFSQQLLTVDARVLPDASLQYANSKTVDVGNAGAWQPAGRATLISPAPLKSWAVLNLAAPSCSSAGVQAFVARLQSELQRQGMACAPPRAIVDGSRHSNTAAALAAAAEQGGLQLVLVVLPSAGGSAEYRQVKEAAAEQQLVTQCLLASKAGISGASADTKAAYVANLLLKINAKLGGANWSLPSGPEAFAPLFRTAQLMVVGVDVGLGQTGSGTPSVAAVVASSDPACSRYSAAIMEQTAGHEVMMGMCEAVTGLLQRYRDQRGCLPDAMLVYRDGVSDSMYASVLQHEVEGGIRRACQAVGGVDYWPKVTFIVVSRSHGTRLMPVSGAPPADSLNRNVLPGTVVDTQLVAPLAYEFFLNSHAALQGTNRPARYNVLVDDSNVGPDGLQLVTFLFSSTYAACPRTLADPAPARYADKAARAGGFLQRGCSGDWVEVAPAQPGQPALQYRLLDAPAGDTMWYL